MGLLEPHGRGRRLLRLDGLTGPVITVHTLAHAIAALTAASDTGREIVLASAPNAGIYAGPGWWREVIRAAREVAPAAKCTALLDCGDDAGAAMAAIRAGVEAIVFTGRSDVAVRLADIAAQRGATLLTRRPLADLDLSGLFFASSDLLQKECADVLASAPAFC